MNPARTDETFEQLLEYVKINRGFDFTGYKRSSLMRRVRRRMEEVGIADFAAYQAVLERQPGEFTQLFNTILINVTDFWRDPDAWAVLAQEHLPRILDAKGANSPLRVWSAGCASGQETYTLVMLLVEALGEERFREQVKVYATDADDEALHHARLASYTDRQMESVPAEQRDRFFEPVSGRWVFRGDLRRHVIFGRHDLVRDAPISRLDLLVSRNTLMYFNAETQTRILSRFHFGLGDGGLLFLGKAEMMRSHGNLFLPVDLKARIFQRAPRANLRDRALMMAQPVRADGSLRMERQLRLRDLALDAGGSPQLVVDMNGAVALANAPARTVFSLSSADVGRPLQDLTVSYRPVELRSRIEQVYAECRPLVLQNVEYPLPDGALRNFDLFITPLLESDDRLVGASIAFVDVTAYHRLHAQLQETNQELETAFEELQSANEELETTNEELQSTIEELETTNEELQSTNEELETMNEELQSTNEELETINDELQRRTSELDNANAYMASILTSVRAAVVVLNRAGQIRIWNRKAEDLWGLRSDEVGGQAFQNLDIGLPVERLKGAVRACMDGTSEYEELVLDAVNRRGRAIQCRVTCTPFVGADREISGAVVLMEEWRDGTEEGTVR